MRNGIVYEVLKGQYTGYATIYSCDFILIDKCTSQTFKFNRNGIFKVTLHFSNATNSSDSAILQRSIDVGKSYQNIVAVGGSTCTCENSIIFNVTDCNKELYAMYTILNNSTSNIMVTIDIENLVS